MAGYLSSRKLTNVRGRISYVINKDKQENIIDYFNTADNEFWKMLAKENQERHKEVDPGGKCCEARELIIGIPQDSIVTAEEMCNYFKDKYNVECACAIHQNNKKGVINRHCHLIFSERQLLSSPEVVEEKRAARTYYYDAKGNKCKKAEAVKVVKKGTLLQKGRTRNFTNKIDFFKTQKFVNECKGYFLKDILKIDWSLESQKRNKQLSEKHIGKNNPKAEYIKQNNKLKAIVKNVCNASDFIFEQEQGTTLEELKKEYKITSFSTTEFEKNENKVYDFVEEIQSMYIDKVKKEVKTHNAVNQDIYFLESGEYIFQHVQKQIIEDYEPQTRTKEKPKVIEFLKNTVSRMLERIKKLIDIQDKIYVETKNQIEIEFDNRDNIHIVDPSYIREQKQIERDDLEPEMY